MEEKKQTSQKQTEEEKQRPNSHSDATVAVKKEDIELNRYKVYGAEEDENELKLAVLKHIGR